jgi:hypothetical protein
MTQSEQGIDLRGEVVSPTVKSTSAALPPLPAAQPEPGFPKPELPTPPTPPSVFVGTEVPAPPVFEEPKPLESNVIYRRGSLVCSCFHDSHPGDSPMLRNWNVLKMSSLLTVAVAFTPLPAVAQGPAEPGDTELEKLSKLVKELKKTCDEQKETSDKQKDALATIGEKLDKLILNTTKGFDGIIKDDLAKIKGDIKALSEDSADTKLTLQSSLGKIKALEDQVATLKSEISRLQKRDPALYPAVGIDDIKVRLEKIETALARLADGRTSFSPPAGAGKIQLANLYPDEILFVINSKPFRVPANTTMELPNQPAGAFTYEVISGTYGARNTPTLEPGKTYTITVR